MKYKKKGRDQGWEENRREGKEEDGGGRADKAFLFPYPEVITFCILPGN